MTLFEIVIVVFAIIGYLCSLMVSFICGALLNQAVRDKQEKASEQVHSVK